MTSEELLKKKSQALKALEKYNKLKTELQENCHHPEEYLVAEEKYYSGGYDYYEETHYWDRCTICLAQLNKKVKMGSHYQ